MNPSETCAPSQSCRSEGKRTEICGIQKWEPQNTNQLLCSAKNCQIFGVHDTQPMTDYPCPARRIKAKDPNKNSLGSPVGMVASNINFKTESKPTDIGLARYATYLKAFARLHLNPETMWTSTLLDDIVREGLTLYSNSEKAENQLDSPADIYTESEKQIQRQFEMSGCQFQVELMRKFTMNNFASAETGGRGDGHNTEEVLLTDLKPALKSFFRRHKHCLLLMGGSVYTMIWRSRDVFFVLDVCGRRLMDFRSDRDNGVAMLMCLKTLENVRHLLIGLTNLNKVQSCTLRELKLVKVVMPSGGVLQRDYGTRVHQYEVVNDDYAYLKASLHLSLNKSDHLRNRSALPAGVVAIVASKIDHPATWNMNMVDKILCFGVNLCQMCWVKCEATDNIDVEEFPPNFHVGQFRVNIELVPRKYEGTWKCIPGCNYSEMAQALEKAFEMGDQKLLIQINQQMYAIWQKQGFIYILDPYRHRILGKAEESEIYEEMEKSATIRMFRSFEVFMNTFNHILLDSNRSSKFSIHTMKIKNIQLSGKGVEEEAQLDVDGEVKSINEHVCFEQSDELCQKALVDISDYEDDELCSDVDELELKTSSSEDEEALEEEEAAASGEEEEMQGLESSSSSEEDTKKKAKGDKVAKKGGGGKKSAKGKKGGKVSKSGKKDKSISESNEREKVGGAPDENKPTMTGERKVENKDEPKGRQDEDIKKKKADGAEDEEAKKKLTGGKGSKDDKDRNEGKAEANKMISGDKDKSDKEEKYDKEEKTKLPDKKPEKVPDKKTEDIIAKNALETDALNKDQKAKDITRVQDKDKDTPSDKNKAKEAVDMEYPKFPKDAAKDHRVERPMERRKVCDKDGSEADDENEDDIKRFCNAPNPNRYPGYYKYPLDMAVVGSENGSYESLCKLLQAGFRLADRILAMTQWGNFVVFRCMGFVGQPQEDPRHYFLFDGCTCNVNRFRHLDLTIGTAGLLCFRHMHDVVQYMRRIRKIRAKGNCRRESLTADEICRQYCR